MLLPERSPEDAEAMRLWLLAGESAKVLRDPSDRDRRERLLNNAYIALQAYEADSLHRTSREAFEGALADCWPSLGRPEAVAVVTERLRAVAYPGDGVASVPDEEAAAFFERVRDGADRSRH